MVTPRCFRPDEWRRYRELRLRALAEAPDAFGGTLDEASALSDAQWAGRLAAVEGSARNLPLLAESDGVACGMAWVVVVEPARDVAQLFQMWVARGCRGRGVGTALLNSAVAWARSQGVQWVDLSVTCGNSPARRLYEAAGFLAIGAPEPLRPGSTLLAQPMRLEIERHEH